MSDKDQAAAILGTAHDAYFDVPCEACGGRGELMSDIARPEQVMKCPVCNGTGETGMPHPDTILRAAKTLVGT